MSTNQYSNIDHPYPTTCPPYSISPPAPKHPLYNSPAPLSSKSPSITPQDQLGTRDFLLLVSLDSLPHLSPMSASPGLPSYLDKKVKTSPPPWDSPLTGLPPPLIFPHQQVGGPISEPTITIPTTATKFIEPLTYTNSLKFRTLLKNEQLITSVHAHCDINSLLLALYQAYITLTELEEFPNAHNTCHPLEANLIEALNQLGVFKLL